MRPSAFLQTDDEQILLDISPDFYQQFQAYNTGVVPRTVLVTQPQHSHTGGLNDYADLCNRQHAPALIISPPDIIDGLRQQYAHLEADGGIQFLATRETFIYPWHVTFQHVHPESDAYTLLFHGPEASWAYMPTPLPDLPESRQLLRELDLLIVGISAPPSGQYQSHSNNVCTKKRIQHMLALQQQLAIRTLIFTCLTHNLYPPDINNYLSPTIRFAQDGMEIQVPV
jgi:phosphoribosyl 1,2-cyclic phosphate phosphodiesterase